MDNRIITREKLWENQDRCIRGNTDEGGSFL